mmetsp:Transcript_14603/g.18053  ORF Transcript_14603/g.18053 Transcript_14603/m.18053 type:complete len:271 (-) Transcript_14603:133-945(-)
MKRNIKKKMGCENFSYQESQNAVTLDCFQHLSDAEDSGLMDIILDTYDSDHENLLHEVQPMQKSNLLSGFGYEYTPKARAHSLEEPLKPLKSEDIENQLNRINKELEFLKESEPVATGAVKQERTVTKRPVIAGRSKVEKCLTPKFIREELKKANGTGEFTKPELMITLFYAYKYFDHSNAYSKVRARMSNVRSRASIRRKIEKIVAQERGISGGLLLKKEKREEFSRVILDRFWKTIKSVDQMDEPRVRTFTSQMRSYCQKQQIFPMEL